MSYFVFFPSPLELSHPLSPTAGLLFHLVFSCISSFSLLSSPSCSLRVFSHFLSSWLLSSPLFSSPSLSSYLISFSLFNCVLSLPLLFHLLSPFPLSSALAGSNPSFVLCGWMNVTGLHTKQAGSLTLGRAQRLNRITHIFRVCVTQMPQHPGVPW